jgi:hypothetical protein
MKGTSIHLFFGSYGLCVFWPSLFVSLVMVLAIDLLLDFCDFLSYNVIPRLI